MAGRWTHPNPSIQCFSYFMICWELIQQRVLLKPSRTLFQVNLFGKPTSEKGCKVPEALYMRESCGRLTMVEQREKSQEEWMSETSQKNPNPLHRDSWTLEGSPSSFYVGERGWILKPTLLPHVTGCSGLNPHTYPLAPCYWVSGLGRNGDLELSRSLHLIKLPQNFMARDSFNSPWTRHVAFLVGWWVEQRFFQIICSVCIC